LFEEEEEERAMVLRAYTIYKPTWYFPSR
jgi:hypothetical protein